MRYHSKILLAGILALCSLFPAMNVVAQQAAVYNINKYNGLATNHVYFSLVDRLGYLWISTSDGVYRYNGYTLKRYDYKDDLPNTDVWNMYEDREGRIWLKSIAKGIGYIKNNRYYPAVIRNDSIAETIYPGDFLENDSLLFFTSLISPPGAHTWATVYRDTVTLRRDVPTVFKVMYLTRNNVVFADDSVTELFPVSVLTNGKWSEYTPERRKSPIKHLADFSGRTINFSLEDVRYFSDRGADSMCLFNVKSNTIQTIFTRGAKNEQIAFVSNYKNRIYCLTNQNVYTITAAGKIIDTTSYHETFPSASIGSFNATCFSTSELWGKTLGTNDRGFFINFPTQNSPERPATCLDDYQYISGQNDSSGFWWNSRENMICRIYGGRVTKTIPLKSRVQINRIVAYDSGKALLMAPYGLHWLYNDGIMVNILTGIDSITGLPMLAKDLFSTSFASVHDMIIVDSTNFIVQGSIFLGCAHVTIDYETRKVYFNRIDAERCNGLLYSPPLNCYILYSSDKIILYNIHSKTKSVVTPKMLKALGIRRIEKIASDSHGNLFIRDYDRILVFNPITGRFSTLLENYNFQNGFISTHGNVFSAAGIFGALRGNTTAEGKIKDLRVYPNTKAHYYKYIYDVQFFR